MTTDFDLARNVASMLGKLTDDEKKAFNMIIEQARCPGCRSADQTHVCPSCGRPYGPIQQEGVL